MKPSEFIEKYASHPHYKAPRGTELHALSRQTEAPLRMLLNNLDGSDAVSDWALLNLMSNTAGGATWVSFHHGGGVGMGYSQHAGMVVLADGTDKAERSLHRVLFNDPALGIFRHADAGYEQAVSVGKRFDILL